MKVSKSRISVSPKPLSLRHSDLFTNLSSSERVALINLGCVRNLVDSEIILGQVKAEGGRIVDLAQADTVIVNTCAFVMDAKKETIGVLTDLVHLKKEKKIKKIIAVGCFAKRYEDIIQKEFPEIDQVFGVLPLEKDKNLPRVFLTPPWYAYLKICESCYNHCSFCAIPSIKGKFSSREMNSILSEVVMLEKKGVKELNIIGQDVTAYGLDLAGKADLAALLKGILAHTERIHWIRLLYAFPKHITDDLLTLMAKEERICKYLDVPLQHISERILLSMNRKFTQTQTKTLIERIRTRVPQCSLRTAFIVGYPGETDKEFKELCQFVQDFAFDHVGVFQYSKEEGTKAAQIKNQIPGRIKRERYNTLMKIQQSISKKNLERFVGQKIEVVIDEKEEKEVFIGRSQYDAPEADGVVYVKTRQLLQPGDFIQVKVYDNLEYDLLAQT